MSSVPGGCANAFTGPDYRWSPGIGDPTIIGWVTVAAYGSAFIACVACARVQQKQDARQRFWIIMAVIMALLGVNKQLDLQTWFTQTGRDLALAQGWYEERQAVQIAFIAALVLAAAGAMVFLQRAVGRLGREARWAATGLLLLAVFVVLRAASFHHIDRMLNIRLGTVTFNAVLELGGIACILIAAVNAVRRARLDR